MLGANSRVETYINQANYSSFSQVLQGLGNLVGKQWGKNKRPKKATSFHKNKAMARGLIPVPLKVDLPQEEEFKYLDAIFRGLLSRELSVLGVLVSWNCGRSLLTYHLSQQKIATLSGFKDVSTVNRILQLFKHLHLIDILPQRDQKSAVHYVLGRWAINPLYRERYSSYIDCLSRKSPNLLRREYDNTKSNYVEDSVPDDMSANEWRRVRGITPQKAKGSELSRAFGERCERPLSVNPQKVVIMLGKRIMEKDLVAPRPAPEVMTNSAESAKLVVDKDSFSERDSAVNYYNEDDEAQPYKSSYQRTRQPEQPRATQKWVAPQYENLPEDKVNELRFAAIQNPEFQQAYETMRKFVGEEAANQWLEKVLDNVARKEVVPAHTIVVSHA